MRKKGFYRECVMFLLLMTVLIIQATPVFGDNLDIPGTGACEPILADLARSYNEANPGDTVTVPPSTGSGGGIAAVLKGQSQLARVARPLKEAELQQGLISLIFARDAVAFVVGRDVKVKNLSSDQLAAIFSGKIKNWKDVGGNPNLIRVIGREPGDSSLSVIEARINSFRNLTVPPPGQDHHVRPERRGNPG